jgi:leucine dehydrogenase
LSALSAGGAFAEQRAFEYMRAHDFERVVFCNDQASGLRAVIAIHSTVLGPATGGLRMWPYRRDADALLDALRLARAMTYKWAAAGEDRGGGKAVIAGDPRSQKTEAVLRAFGRFVDRLHGDYFAGSDVGIGMEDMEVIHRETDYVATLPEHAGGAGDISFATAYGVLQAMRACAKRVWGNPSLEGRSVALQGLGACGSKALAMLLEAGTRVVVSDIDGDRVRSATADGHVTAVDPEHIHAADVDIFAPFALGGALNSRTVPELKARVVAGSANNLISDEHAAEELERRRIVCAVDYIANAGGALFDADRFHTTGFVRARAMRSVERIFDRTEAVFARAEREGISPQRAADRIAEDRLAAIGHVRSL